MRLIATSDQKAFVMHHLAKHPAEMQKLLDLTGKGTPADLDRQASAFRRLEGRVEGLHSSAKNGTDKDDKKNETKPPETAAERDARKNRPSESAAPRGGSAPVTDISPVLADGKTLNPAWKEQKNARAAARR
jgi:hypothetical protein